MCMFLMACHTHGSWYAHWCTGRRTRDEAANADACLCGSAPKVRAVNPRPCGAQNAWCLHMCLVFAVVSGVAVAWLRTGMYPVAHTHNPPPPDSL